MDTTWNKYITVLPFTHVNCNFLVHKGLRAISISNIPKYINQLGSFGLLQCIRFLGWKAFSSQLAENARKGTFS